MSFGSPNHVLWQFSGILDRLASAKDVHCERAVVEQNGTVAVLVAATSIEAFTNIYFRVVADEPQFLHSRAEIIQGLEERTLSTAVKLLKWCELAFHQRIDERDSRWVQFKSLQSLRNNIVHFKSSHDSLQVDDIRIDGLVGLSAFAQMSEATPIWAVNCVRGVVGLVGECRGIAKSEIAGFVRHWAAL